MLCPTTPCCNRLQRGESTILFATRTQKYLPTCKVWAFPLSLATTQGILFIQFLFFQLLRCFTSLACLLCTYIFSTGYPDMTRDGFPHSEILGLKRLLSTIRDLSQTATSFFGFLCQGIHHILLITYLNFFFRTLICCYKTTKPELKKPP